MKLSQNRKEKRKDFVEQKYVTLIYWGGVSFRCPFDHEDHKYDKYEHKYDITLRQYYVIFLN